MKITCPDCRQRFEIRIDDYDEGDYLNCPECNLEMTIVLENGKLAAKSAKEKDLSEEEFDEYFDE